MDRPLRTLQPAGPVDRPFDSSPPVPPSQAGKRKHIGVACNACRKRKSRCDGQRPTCHLCKTKNTTCEYDSVRRKSIDALTRLSQVEGSLASALTVFEHLQRCPSPDAQGILRRIRSGEDVYTVSEGIMSSDVYPDPHDDLDFASVGESASQAAAASTHDGDLPEQPSLLLPSLQPSGLDDFSTATPESGLPWLHANPGLGHFENLDDAQYPTYPFDMTAMTSQGAGVDILADAARRVHEQQQGDDSPDHQ